MPPWSQVSISSSATLFWGHTAREEAFGGPSTLCYFYVSFMLWEPVDFMFAFSELEFYCLDLPLAG